MLQRLAQFRVALSEFPEEAHVFNRDHGLIGEGLEQRDLFVREWSDFQAANRYRSDGNALAQKWDG